MRGLNVAATIICLFFLKVVDISFHLTVSSYRNKLNREEKCLMLCPAFQRHSHPTLSLNESSRAMKIFLTVFFHYCLC